MRTIILLLLLSYLMPLSFAICDEKEFEYSMPIILLPIMRVLQERDGGSLAFSTHGDARTLIVQLSMEIFDIE